MGKSSINGPFSMAMLNNQRVQYNNLPPETRSPWDGRLAILTMIFSDIVVTSLQVTQVTPEIPMMSLSYSYNTTLFGGQIPIFYGQCPHYNPNYFITSRQYHNVNRKQGERLVKILFWRLTVVLEWLKQVETLVSMVKPLFLMVESLFSGG